MDKNQQQPTATEDTKEEIKKEEVVVEKEVDEAQDKNGNSALRKKLIEANKMIAELQNNNKTENSLPKEAIDILKSLSDDDDTADKIARALSEMSKSQFENFMKERESLKTKAEKQQQIQELEAEQLLEDVISEYQVQGIKITKKELEKAVQKEFGDDSEVDERSIRLIAKLIAKEKAIDFSKEANERKTAVSQIDKLSNQKEAPAKRVFDLRTGKINFIN